MIVRLTQCGVGLIYKSEAQSTSPLRVVWGHASPPPQKKRILQKDTRMISGVFCVVLCSDTYMILLCVFIAGSRLVIFGVGAWFWGTMPQKAYSPFNNLVMVAT